MAVVNIEVLHNGKQLRRWLTDQERRQLPFANALALTRTAQHGQRRTRDSIPRRFKLKMKSMPRAAVRIRPAFKRDWPNAMEASVGITRKFRFLADHEKGVIRRPSRGHRLTIPKAVKRTTRGKIPAAKTPTRVRAKKSVYVDEGLQEIRRKVRKGAVDRRRILYLLRPFVRIKRRLGMRTTVTMSVREVHRAEFRKAWRQAMGKGGDRALIPG